MVIKKILRLKILDSTQHGKESFEMTCLYFSSPRLTEVISL